MTTIQAHYKLVSRMSRGSKFFKSIDPCLRIFDFFGFIVLTIPSRTTLRQKFRVVYVLVKYGAILCLLGLLFIDSALFQINNLRDRNGIFIHLIIYIGSAMTAFCSLIQSLVCSKSHVKLLKSLEIADILLTKCLKVKIQYAQLRRTLLLNTVFSLFVNFVCSILVTLFSMQINPDLWRLGVCFYIPIMLSRIFAQKFVFTVQLLSFYLRITLNVLEISISNQPLIVNAHNKERMKWISTNNFRKLVVLQAIYKLMWETSMLINNCYGFTLLNIFIMHCVSMIYNGYTSCIDISKHRFHNRQLVSIIMTSFGIFTVHYFCRECTRNVNLCFHIINHDIIQWMIDILV